MKIEMLKNPFKQWFEARKEGRVIYFPYGVHNAVESERANEVRRYLNSKDIELCVFDYDEAEEISSKLEEVGVDINVPEDNMVDCLIDVDGIFIFIQGADEYQGHGESTFSFGVEGIIPNGKSIEEIQVVIDWLCEVFKVS